MDFASDTGDPLPSEVESAVADRQRRILAFVKTHGYATIEALADAFDVSMQTVRRDVIQLDKAKLLQRFHGGAGIRHGSVRLGYVQKSAQNVGAKTRIGETAARMVPEGGSVYLDVGTTAEAIARALLRRGPRVVVTNSMAAATVLAGERAIEVVVTGGVAAGADGSLTGEAAVRSVSAFRVDVAFIACSGFDVDGSPMDFDLGKTAVKQAAIAASRRAVLIADATKFARQALIRIAAPSAFAGMVTDRQPKPDREAAVAQAGYTLVLPDNPG